MGANSRCSSMHWLAACAPRKEAKRSEETNKLFWPQNSRTSGGPSARQMG